MLNTILLIDDDEATNFWHQVILEKSSCCHKIITFTNGEQALEYLKSPGGDGLLPSPELIFLDLNLPGMNGWRFLEHYKQLPQEQKSKIHIIILTTSLNPADEAKANTIPDVSGFQSKPLSKGHLQRILQRFFSDRF